MSGYYDENLAYEAVLHSVNLDWGVDETAAFDAVLKNVRNLAGFERIQILRDDIEIFDGRYEALRIGFGQSGKHPMPISGFDWTRRLADFTTPSTDIVDSSTVNALNTILSDSDFAVDVDGEFEYISPLEEWLTWLDFVLNIDFYYHATVEIDLTKDTWISQTVNDDTDYTLPNIGLKGAFMYDWNPPSRLYLWACDTSNNIWYFHSTDGENWTAVDSGKNSHSNAWSVSWSGSEVYLFYYDGANTDFSYGTIDAGTGTITWIINTANIFAGEIRFGPVFDNDWDVWVIAEAGSGTAYESTDLGATWNNRFGPGADELWGLAQVGSDGDMYGICLDTVNDDIEEWLWDRSAGTFAFTQKIADQSSIDGLDVVQDAALNMYVTWVPGNTIYLASNQSGGWLQVAVTSTVSFNTFDTSCDGYNCYVFYSNAAGFQAKKYHSTDLIESWANSSSQNPLISTPHHITTTRCYLQDGKIAVYCGVAGDPAGDSLQSAIWEQRGVRITEGYTSGYFYTYIVSLVAMSNWGILTGVGEAFDDGESVLWDVQNGDAPFQYLIADAEAPFDLEVAGVSNAITNIWVYGKLDDNGTDPYIREFEITGKSDSVTMSVDYDDCYTGVNRLADLAGAEFYVTFDGSTWTLHFTDRRGEDKSGWLVLKAASSSERPDIEPNIKVLNKKYDWSGYANVVRCIGGEDSDGDRVVEYIRDNEEIADKNQEHWATIRNASVTTSSMARQLAYLELTQRNTVKHRVSVEFLDKEVTNRISVGDSVMLLASWEHEGLEIKEAYRIINLNRRWGAGGETVTAELSNNLRYAEYVNYMKKTDDLERWLTT